MNIITTAHVGPMRFRLIEKPSAMGPDFFAPRYYYDVRHSDAPQHVGIGYLDHGLTYARRLFQRRVDTATARQMVDADDGH